MGELLGDWNENVYTGRIAKRLAESNLNMKEQFLHTTQTQLKGTFIRGNTLNKVPLDACFATAGVICLDVMALPFKKGCGGDHRCTVLDFCTASILGLPF